MKTKNSNDNKKKIKKFQVKNDYCVSFYFKLLFYEF